MTRKGRQLIENREEKISVYNVSAYQFNVVLRSARFLSVWGERLPQRPSIRKRFEQINNVTFIVAHLFLVSLLFGKRAEK